LRRDRRGGEETKESKKGLFSSSVLLSRYSTPRERGADLIHQGSFPRRAFLPAHFNDERRKPMKVLSVQVAHGWWTEGQSEETDRVDYYAIGAPEPSRLVVNVSLRKDGSPCVNPIKEHTQLAEVRAASVADYAAHWSMLYAGLLSEHTGGGEMLSDEAVIILASIHPDWFMGRDLCHILSAVEDEDDKTLGDELSAARDDLRVFVEALHSQSGEVTVEKFPLGRIVATPGALAALDEAEQSPYEFLDRHVRGDWGEVCEEDAKENEFSLESELRLLSAYTTKKGEKVWVITEADRSSTTILLPEEY
jgi:hypothetical protein